MDFTAALSWRIQVGVDGAHYMYFDAAKEAPFTRALTEGEESRYLDSVVSVSAVDRDRDQLSLKMDAMSLRSSEGLLPF